MASRRNRKSRQTGRVMGKGNVRARAMRPQDWQNTLQNSGLVFAPSAEHPMFGMAMTQHQITGGGFTPDVLARFFPDGVLIDNIGTILEMFDFGVAPAEIDARFGMLTGYMFSNRGTWGFSTALRMLLASVDAMFSDIRIHADPKEDVFHVEYLKDGQLDDGWDYEFPAYGLYTQKFLKSSVNHAKAQRFLTAAHVSRGNKLMRQLVKNFIDIQYSDQFPTDPVFGGAFGESYFRQQPHLLAVEGDSIDVGGQTINGLAFGEALERLGNAHLGQTPVFPIRGRTVSMLSDMQPIHKFGYVGPKRSFPHTGIDLVDDEGKAVVSMYDGEIVAVKDDWKAGGGAQGNFVIVRHLEKIEGEMRKATTEYNHLQGVPAGLKAGQTVKAGETIGYLGTTGNSTGPHLHLVVSYSHSVNEHGRSLEKIIVDPEQVIRRGLLPYMMTQGYHYGDAMRPGLSVGGVMLQNIAAGEVMWPGFLDQVQDVVEQVQQAGQQAAQKVNQAASVATQVGGAVLSKGFKVFGPGTPARAFVEGMYGVAFPGMGIGPYAGKALDALQRGHETNMNGGDVQAILESVFSGWEVSDEDKARAVQMGMNAYVNYSQNNSQE